MRKKLLTILTVCLLVSLPVSVFSHSGRTDGAGGHRDNKNKSGLGSYHYHCGGFPPHLHNGGVCPYKSGGSSSSSSSSGSSSSLGTTSSGSATPSYTPPKPVYAARINVSNMPQSLFLGESVTLSGAVYPSNAEDNSITWESDNPSIATVSSDGEVEAVGEGTVTLTATTSRGTSSSFTLTIKPIVAESISIYGKKSEITVGSSLALSVDFEPKNTTHKDVKWKSEIPNVATVNSEGILTATSVGKTKITAIHDNITDSFEIEILPVVAENVEISVKNPETQEKYEEIKLKKGETVELTANILPENTTDKTVVWSVDDENIAEITDDCILTTKNNGTVNVALTSNTKGGFKI